MIQDPNFEPHVLEIYSYLHLFGLAAARMVGLIMIMPLFTRMGIAGIRRGGVALALAAPVVPYVFSMVPPDASMTSGMLIMLTAKEILIGFMLGVLFGIPIWAAETAGEILDLQRGSSAAQLFDPLFMSELNITGTLLSLIMVALFFTSGAFMMMMGGFYDSFALWPITELWPVVDTKSSFVILRLLDKVMSMAVVLAAPVMIALFLSDVLLAFLSRAASNLHVFDLSLSVKNLVFTVMMSVYCVFMISYMNGNISHVLDVPGLMDAIAPDRP